MASLLVLEIRRPEGVESGLAMLNTVLQTPFNDDQSLPEGVRSTGAELVALRGHTARINDASFSRQCSQVVTASLDEIAIVWSADTGQMITKKSHDGVVYSARFSPDGKHIVTASGDYTARIWPASDGHQEDFLSGHDGLVLEDRRPRFDGMMWPNDSTPAGLIQCLKA